jgi:uncharacterized membrane protein
MKNQIGSSVLGKTLSVVLVLIILSAIVALAYNVAVPPVTEKFTEFYVLNSEGKADNYPQNLAVGEEAKVIVGIVNREHETLSYRIEVKINQVKTDELGPLVLKQAEKRQETITFQPAAAGNNQKVEFLLYKSGQSEVYRSVYILVNVR